jgi:hypothetical protein
VKNAFFWDVTPCGSCSNRRFGIIYHFHHQSDKNRRAKSNVHLLLVSANVVPSSPIFVTLMMKATAPSKYRFLQESHGVTFQKTTFFILTAVRISILT